MTKEKRKEKGKGPNTPAARSTVSEGSGSVEDLSEYEEEEREESRREKGTKDGTMAKAVVIHEVPTNSLINGVADCAGRIRGGFLVRREGRGRQLRQWLSTYKTKSPWDRRLL